MKNKYFWNTDLHLGSIPPWTFLNFVRHIRKEKPNGIFLTGDISTGPLLTSHLALMARFIKCPIYFVLGNHDMHFSSIEVMKAKVRNVCKKYSNLIWLTDSDVVALNNDVALIGAEGWYDANFGSYKYMQATLDWILIDELRNLKTMKERVDAFKKMADESISILEPKLKKAISSGHKRIYVLTHFPPWAEAPRNENKIFKSFHLSYDTNIRLGKMIERVMNDHKDVNITVLCGHTHFDAVIYISPNIECKVISNKYYGFMRNEEQIFI
jgi:predicted phosphohydrolase